MQLRSYQSRAVTAVLAARRDRPILVAPTGSGKTVMGVAITERFSRVLWLAHRKELIEQAAAHLRVNGAFVGIIKAGVAPAPLARIQVASVQSLARRDNPPADLVVVDECHHSTADGYRRILRAYPDAMIVGLTATPFRLDGRGLGSMFGKIIVAATTAELCDQGFLHAPRVWASSAPDLRGVRTTAGDYNLGDLSRRVNDSGLTGDIVQTWRRRADGRRTVVFAVDVSHSEAITEAFRSAGVPAEHLDGKTPEAERSAILSRLRSGETQVVSNCMVLTEGWDLPALECAVIARPTASLNLHLQMVGRIMRAADGKDGAIVLDHAGNHHVHGMVTRRLDYTLDGSTRVGSSEPLGLRRCQRCGLMYTLGTLECPECGWEPEVSRAGEVTAESGELTEFNDDDHAYRAEVWRLLEAEREAAGFRDGWSWFRFIERFGAEPVLGEIDGRVELIDPATAGDREKEAVYKRLLAVAGEKGFKQGWASHKYKDTFGVWPRGFVSRARLAAFGRKLVEVRA